jgi:voltage-gated potassium channel
MRKKLYSVLKTDAQSKLSVIYDRFMLVCIICSIVPLFFKQSNIIFVLFDNVTVVVFIIDYILRWITADYTYANNKKIAFLKYPFSFYAIIDLLSILPSLSVLNNGFKLFKLFRLNKTFRAFKLLRYSKNFNLIVSVIKKESRALISVCVLAGGYILLSALIMFQVEPDSFDTFFDALYWAVVTLTTVGYGDVYPASDVGRIVSMVSSFMGIAVVALPTGIITAGYMSELNK